MEKHEQGISFRFARSDTIGAPDAESDDGFLNECFVDTGDLAILRDCSNQRRIVVGRTGAGKSALLKLLASTAEHVIELQPSNLSLNFLANSEVLNFFDQAGANLDPFYQLLWKHVLAVELLRKKYGITNESSQRSFFSSLQHIFARDRAKEQAVRYLEQWGSTFWNETELRVREVQQKIEETLVASMATPLLGIEMKADAASKLSAEARQEVISRGARAVSQIQVSALSTVLDLLENTVFTDRQESYYVTIDDLDLQWAVEPLKSKLIRALIETVRAFRKVHQVKIIVALRVDLLERVIATTRDAGFQSEKYESLYVKLRWTKVQIVELVNRRLECLVKQRYTSKAVTLQDLFPQQMYGEPFSDYLCDRTFLRPRDAIAFVNECLRLAADKHLVTSKMVSEAEGAYSEKRRTSLREEWTGVYPSVAEYLEILARKPNSFPASELSESVLESWAETFLFRHDYPTDPVQIATRRFFIDGKGSPFEVVLVLLKALYVVGAVGLKLDAGTPVVWSYEAEHTPADGAIRPSCVVHVHPTFWRALGIRPKGR